MQLSTGYFRSDFAKIAIFISEMLFNSASVLIRFFEVFLKGLSIKVDMHAYWTITYAYTIILVPNLCQNLEILSRNAIRFYPFYPVQFRIRPVLMYLCVK